MKNEMNMINLDTSDNEKLQNYFAAKNPGDTCEMTVRTKLISNDDGKPRLTIEEVDVLDSASTEDDSSNTYSENDEGEGDESPVVLLLGSKK